MKYGQPNYWNLYVRNSDFKFYKDNIFLNKDDNIQVNKDMHVFNSVKVESYDNTANVALNWSPNGVARIRVGGQAPGATNGFEIQSPGDYVEMKVKHNAGGTFVRGLHTMAHNTYDIGTSTSRFKNMYLSNTAICNQVTTKKVYFDTDRAWYFEQGGSGGSASLDLTSTTDGKAFNIYGVDKVKRAQFYSTATLVNLSMDGSIYPNGTNKYTLGNDDNRWQTIYSINTLNTSDKAYKEDIEYLDPKLRSNLPNQSDLHKFYKDDFKLATYKFKGQEHNEYGFIAQDFASNEIGEKLLINCGEGYMYSIGSYISSVAGALQHEIHLRDEQIKNLEDRLTALEELLKGEMCSCKNTQE